MKKDKRKTDLKSSILILLILAILLVASTYAWFTSNRTVQVSELDVTVQAKNGLQISADATNWKSLLQLADLTSASYTGIANQIPTVLEPVSSPAVLDENGHMQMYYGQVEADTDNVSDTYGQYVLTSKLQTDLNGSGDNAGKYIAFDMYLKVQTETPIYLTSGSNVISAETGTTKSLENAARVAFVIEGNTPEGSTPATMQALKTSDVSNIRLWEPNRDLHKDEAIQNALSLYGKTITNTAGQNALAYDALKAEIEENETSHYYGVALNKTTATENGDSFVTMSPTWTSIKDQESSIGTITLQPGVTKIRTYMWVEGQDVDCENSASGAKLGFNVQFSMDNV